MRNQKKKTKVKYIDKNNNIINTINNSEIKFPKKKKIEKSKKNIIKEIKNAMKYTEEEINLL